VFRKVKTGHKQAMKEYSVKQFRQIDDLVVLIRSPLSSNDRKKFNTVLIIDVHARDIIDTFVRDSILDAREFQWESQLRSVQGRIGGGGLAPRVRHGLDSSMDWIGLGRILGDILWIELDWVT